MADEFREFISHLTENARTSLNHANLIAHGSGSSYIGTEHLLLGILAQGSSIGAKILADFGITLDKAQAALNLAPVLIVVAGGEYKGLSETAKLTLKMSWDIANQFNDELMGTEHILYSIINQKNSRASLLLKDMNANMQAILSSIEEVLNGESLHESSQTPERSTKNPGRTMDGPLGVFGYDLTRAAKDGLLDPVIGRTSEIERAITIISRRIKNNPVLIGEPGVGKTAIAEGLAIKISGEDVPDFLLNKKLIRIDLSAMIAGTKYRGEFEDRLKKLISQVEKRNDVILFIDEIHLLVGAGSAEGSIDAANMLKPALARGEIKIIGATTTDEYRKHIEKDSALSRRFQTILIKEPNLKNTIQIIKGLRKKYEDHHGVVLNDSVIEMAVNLADRYVTERFMPDKAIDVIDEASAFLRVKRGEKPSRLRELQRELSNLEAKIDEAVASEDYERAAIYKTRSSQVEKLLSSTGSVAATKNKLVLSDDDVAGAVSFMTGIPLKKLARSEVKLLKNLESHLSKFVIGQEEAVLKVSKAIRRGKSGISNPNRPIGSFIFLGPTGVGKTELAKVIAREIFGSDDSLIKIDMSEFGEKHNVSRLVGAPAGYVGFEEGGKLTDKIRRQPHSVVLFDEIEKAHRDVFNLLLQILEDGKLTDASGQVVDFSNTIVILTSNIGSDSLKRESSLGFQATTNDDKKHLEELHEINAREIEASLLKIMKPELVNRFDNIITFNALTHDDINKIFDNYISDLKDRIALKGLGLSVTNRLKKYLISNGYNDKYGARPLRRVIQEELEHEIADGLISNSYPKGSILKADLIAKKVVVSIDVENAQN